MQVIHCKYNKTILYTCNCSWEHLWYKIFSQFLSNYHHLTVIFYDHYYYFFHEIHISFSSQLS